MYLIFSISLLSQSLTLVQENFLHATQKIQRFIAPTLQIIPAKFTERITVADRR